MVAATIDTTRTHEKTASLITLSVLLESEKTPQRTFHKVSGGSDTEPLGKASPGLDSGIPASLAAASRSAKLGDLLIAAENKPQQWKDKHTIYEFPCQAETG
jgi:hypothetical protein